MTEREMTKSQMIERMAIAHQHLPDSDVAFAVNALLERMGETLAAGGRIEIRGFGSFCLHCRPPRMARNPRTGETIAVPARQVPHFKPGKALRDRVNTIGQ
jgi:integration host factor subunit beta